LSYVPKNRLPPDFVRLCDGFLYDLVRKYPSDLPVDWAVSPDVETTGPTFMVDTILLPPSFVGLWEYDRESMEPVIRNVLAHEYAHFLIRIKSMEPRAVHAPVPPFIRRSLPPTVSQFYADKLAFVWSGVPKRLAMIKLRRLMRDVIPTTADRLRYSEGWRKVSVPLMPSGR